MPWPPQQPTRDQIPLEELGAYAAVMQRAKRFRAPEDPEKVGAGYWGKMLLSPPMAAGFAQVGQAMRMSSYRDDGYSHAEREWVDQVVAARLRTNILQRLHLPDAVAAGVRPEAIAALRAGRDHELTPDERELTNFIDCFLEGRMTKEVWETIERRFGERGTLEYAAAVAYISAAARLQQAVGLPEPSDVEVDSWLGAFVGGDATPPDDWESRNR